MKQTIPQALFAGAEQERGEFVFHLDDGIVRLPSRELAERASRGARRLVALGVKPGEPVGVLGPNRPEWVVSAFAVWMAGATLVPVQIPLRVRDPDAFRAGLRSVVAAGRCRCVLTDPDLMALLPDGVAVAWGEGGEESGEALPAPAADDAAVLQFTSGSTARPKGALLTHANVIAQVRDVLRAYRYGDGSPRSILSWAPFFHDLGLFANLVQPVFAGATVHQLPTERFARDPLEWLRLVERTRVALTVGPSSAFGSAFRAADRRGERPDLGSLEIAYFAAEGVDPDVAGRIVESAGEFGLDPRALGSTYGLAEAVMAVSYSAAGSGLSFDRVSLRALTADGVAAPADEGPARVLVSCGPPLMDLRIVDRGGEERAERQVGEIQVRGPSVMGAYVGVDVPDPFVDGWLQTGDLGYLAGGELHVTGREKDLIIAGGHNYYPEDFEWAASRTDGVRPGRCVAFALPGTEEVVVLVEAQDDARAELERDVRREVANAVGIRPSGVVVLPPGIVEKTTSGKLRRAAMRDRYLSGTLADAGS
ncbi:MAG TPA: AMP-binding protein [Solirubrobacterales bacterium]|nr:AMP-binding protein [Solirubrobacterales bacterium]